MMTGPERAKAIEKMDSAVGAFYVQAVSIGNHPFIEFAGVLKAYVNSCRRAHYAGIDFSECSAHSGSELPIESFDIDYLNEKLNCIFGGRIVCAQDNKN